MKRHDLFMLALLVWLASAPFGCGGSDGPVAVPPGTDLTNIKPASTTPGISPSASARASKASPGPQPLPIQ